MSVVRRIALIIVAALSAVAISLGVGVTSAQAAPGFLSAPARSDIQFDDARGLLYVSSGTEVLRYDVAAGRTLSPLVIGGYLRGMDISPDGRTLAVADDMPIGDQPGGTARFHLVDLESGAVRTISFARTASEWGSWMVAYASDGRLLITSSHPGTSSGRSALRAYEPNTGVVTLGLVEAFGVLSASGDRKTIGLSQPQSWTGAWGIYDSDARRMDMKTYWTGVNSMWASDISVNRDGSQYALVQGMGVSIYGRSGALRTWFESKSVYALKYSPTADILYLFDAPGDSVSTYETDSYQRIGSYDLERPQPTNAYTGQWYWARPSVIPWPRMAIPRDNGMLASTVADGVSYVRMRPAVVGNVRSSPRGFPVEGASVQVWREQLGHWSPEATVVTGPGGSWTYVTDDTSPVRIRASASAAAFAPAWYGGTALDNAASVVPSLSPPPSADTALDVIGTGAIAGTLTSSWDQSPAEGIVVSLFQEGDASTVVATSTTDSSGRYRFDNLVAAKYRIGFADETGEHTRSFYRSAGSFGTALRVAVTAGSVVSAPDTLTYLPLRVGGRVLSAWGDTPISGAMIGIWRRNANGSYAHETTVAAGTDGVWSFETDRPAEVRLRVVDPLGTREATWFGGSDLQGATGIAPTRAAPIPSCDVRMAVVDPSRIEGRVFTSRDGGPLPGVVVSLRSEHRPESVVATALSDARGVYSFEGVDLGTYSVGFADLSGAHRSALIQWSSGMNTWVVVGTRGTDYSVQDWSLEWRPARVSGVATSNFLGLRVHYADVELWRRGAEGGYSLEATMAADPSNGGFVYPTDDLNPIRVRWVDRTSMHAPVWIGGSTLESATDLYPSRETAPRADVEMQIANPGAVSGIARSGRGGGPVAGVDVTLYHAAFGRPALATTKTAGDGSFSFGGLGATEFRLGFADPSGNHYPQTYPPPAPWYEPSFPITQPGTVTVDEVLAFIPYSLSGTVTSTYRTRPIAGASVGIWRQDESAGWRHETTLTADASGRWSFSTETTEPARVFVVDPRGAHDSVWVGGAAFEGAAQFEPSRGGLAVSNVTLSMTHPATIVGKALSGKNGTPLGGVVATLYTDDIGRLAALATTVTAGDGSYSFDGLGPSTFRIGFVDPSGNHVALPPGAPIAITGPVGISHDVTLAFIPYDVHGVVTSDVHGVPLPNASVEVWREDSSAAWVLADVVTTDFDGGWQCSVDSSAPVRLRIVDNGTMCETAWFGGTNVNNARDVVPARGEGASASVTLHVARAATIEGIVFDGYLMSPVRGCTVTLYGANGSLASVLASTTTAADGSYRFTGVGPSDYLLYFSDNTGKYWGQWYDYQDEAAFADTISVDLPGQYEADAYLDPTVVQYHGTFTTPKVTSDNGQVWAGRKFTLQADLYDAIWAFPIDWIPVVVQSSTDGATWATVGLATADPDSSGTYTFSYTPSDARPRHFRFACATTLDALGTSSPSIPVQPQLRTATWEGVTCNGATAPVLQVESATFILEGSLRDQFGALVSGATVRVQQSLDGRTWFDAAARVTYPARGRYQATVETGRGRMYRLELRPGGTAFPLTSGGTTVIAPRKVDCWPSNRTPRAGRKVDLSGWTWPRSKVGSHDARIVVQRKSRGVWRAYKTYRPALVNGATNASRARLNVAMKKRGAYRVRMTVPGAAGFLPGRSEWVEFTVR